MALTPIARACGDRATSVRTRCRRSSGHRRKHSCKSCDCIDLVTSRYSTAFGISLAFLPTSSVPPGAHVSIRQWSCSARRRTIVAASYRCASDEKPSVIRRGLFVQSMDRCRKNSVIHFANATAGDVAGRTSSRDRRVSASRQLLTLARAVVLSNDAVRRKQLSGGRSLMSLLRWSLREHCVVLACVIAAASCGGGDGTGPKVLARIVVNPTSPTIQAGGTQQFTATG